MPHENPKFLYDSRFDDATPSASSTAAGYSVLNLRDWRPYTYWKPSSMPATVTVDCGVPRAADYLLLFGHDLHDALAYAEVRGSTDNFSASDVLVASTSVFAKPEQLSDAVWSKVNLSIAANTALGPFGASNADQLVEDSTVTAGRYFAQSTPYVSGLSYTLSVYAKEVAGSAKRYLGLLLISNAFGNNKTAVFDLAAGTVTATNSGGAGATPTAEIENVGNGWYRCAVTAPATVSTSTGSQIRLSNSSSNAASGWTGDGASGIYVFGAQHGPTSALAAYEGEDNRPLLVPFPSASYRYWRLRLVNASGTTAPTLGLVALGSALQAPVGLPFGFDPLKRETHGQINTSARGYPLGTVIDWEEWQESVDLNWCMWDWVRYNFLGAYDRHLKSKPFVFAWDPGDHANELYLCNPLRLREMPHKAGSYADLRLKLSGVAT